MCGIAGFFQTTAALPRDQMEAIARQMGSELRHRGPDDAGVWVDAPAGIAFSHRRLSVVDLSSEGHQPMCSYDGSFVLVFNGEIYNFEHLRMRLVKCGHRFRGKSDTEVMLAAFCEWGVEHSLTLFNGMFAFAAWDTKNEILWLARDRMGEKPLYYGWLGSTLIFGSELKALKVFPGFRATIDPEAVAAYFKYNYICAPYSIYAGIGKLAAGGVYQWNRRDNKGCEKRYWSLADVATSASQASLITCPYEAIEQLESSLIDAVKLRMVADVPLGAFLSGGVDSSLLVALMQRASSRPVKTYTIGFGDNAYDEAPHARAVAHALGTDHTELYITERELMESATQIPAIYDEPFADSSQVPTFEVCRLARKNVTVSLSGDGPDELFGGYGRHIAAERLSLAAWLPKLLQKGFGTGIGGCCKVCPSRINTDRIRKAAVLMFPDAFASVWSEIADIGTDGASFLDVPSRPLRLASLIEAQERRVSGSLARIMLADGCFYLPDDILAKVDRASMAVSLETRAPFLDERVIALAWRISPALKFRDGQGKWILRQLLKRYVPPAIAARPKAGFSVPMARWMRGHLREWAESSLTETMLAESGLLNVPLIRRSWRELQAGSDKHASRIWGVLVFQGWLQNQK